MKQKFSNQWISSKQPRKQRKFKANAPLHKKHSFLSSHLSKELRKKYGKRSIPIRKGDEALVMRGSFKKKKAKVTTVELKRTRAALENINRTKKDGTKVSVFFNPSSLQIITLNLEDKKRIKSLGVKADKTIKEVKPKEEKTPKVKESKETVNGTPEKK
jgi:large subunit ribosomal protein L24